ncbi:hypothetical protein PROFUN_14856 [Planoprotostelium fungivorum]|uniref:Uncharacterized protein n=2 Tax=Planoprotostelium fungivorum TaxID=1890364 RepID=A0A2P6MYS4_9EUKA|nr:hypothetical protein PROFUN_14856 [Planoprotostelium fungivorum]
MDGALRNVTLTQNFPVNFRAARVTVVEQWKNACWRADDLLQFVEDVLTMAGDIHSEPVHPSVYRTGVADIQHCATGIREGVLGPFMCVYLYKGNALSDRDGLIWTGGTVCEVRRVMRKTQFSSSLKMWRQVSHLTTNEDWRLVEYWTTGIPTTVDSAGCDLPLLLMSLDAHRTAVRSSRQDTLARMYQAAQYVSQMSSSEVQWRKSLYERRHRDVKEDPFNQPLQRGKSLYCCENLRFGSIIMAEGKSALGKALIYLAFGGAIIGGICFATYIVNNQPDEDEQEYESDDDEHNVDEDFLAIVSSTVDHITDEMKSLKLSLEQKKRHYLTVLTAKERVQMMQSESETHSAHQRITLTLREIEQCENLFTDFQ